MKIYSYIILALLSILMPTLSGDSAFYLTKLAAERALQDNIYNNIWSISYGGLNEYVIRTFIKSTVNYIIFYKLFVILFNFYLYNKLYKKNNNALILSSYLALQFFLSPSEYSFVVGGLSAVILSTNEDLIIKKVMWILIGLILLGFDLPNPKYLGLGLLLYISIQSLKENKNLEISFIIALFIIIAGLLVNRYIDSGVTTPPFYTVRNSNGELLDLAGRGFIEALIPFKQNKLFYPLYISLLIFYIVMITYALYENRITKKIFKLIIINYIFSFGIMEPSGIMALFAENFSILSFIRTRAGFDLYFFIYINYLYIYFTPYNRYNIFIRFFIILMISTIIIYGINNYQNFSTINDQANIIDRLQNINTNNGCYLYSDKGYTINPIFGFGPHLVRLTTNFKLINNLNEYEKYKCEILIVDKEVLVPDFIESKYNNKELISEKYFHYK